MQGEVDQGLVELAASREEVLVSMDALLSRLVERQDPDDRRAASRARSNRRWRWALLPRGGNKLSRRSRRYRPGPDGRPRLAPSASCLPRNHDFLRLETRAASFASRSATAFRSRGIHMNAASGVTSALLFNLGLDRVRSRPVFSTLRKLPEHEQDVEGGRERRGRARVAAARRRSEPPCTPRRCSCVAQRVGAERRTVSRRPRTPRRRGLRSASPSRQPRGYRPSFLPPLIQIAAPIEAVAPG